MKTTTELIKFDYDHGVDRSQLDCALNFYSVAFINFYSLFLANLNLMKSKFRREIIVNQCIVKI